WPPPRPSPACGYPSAPHPVATPAHWSAPPRRRPPRPPPRSPRPPEGSAATRPARPHDPRPEALESSPPTPFLTRVTISISDGQHCPGTPAAVVHSGTEMPAHGLGALTHDRHSQPRAGNHSRRLLFGILDGVTHLHLQLTGVVTQTEAGGRPAVLGGIRQGLLGDAVGGLVDLGRQVQIARRALIGGAVLVHQVLARLAFAQPPRRALGGGAAQHLNHRPHLGEPRQTEPAHFGQ